MATDAAAGASRAANEDVGYETAKIKGIDVLSQVAIMLRQRGQRIVRVVDVDIDPAEPNAAPLNTPPDARTTAAAEEWMDGVLSRIAPATLVRACTGAVGGSGHTSLGASAEASAPAAPTTVQPVLVAEIRAEEAPDGSAVKLHLARGLAADRDRTATFLLPIGKIGVKQLRVIRDAIEDETPARIIVAAREKIQTVAMDVLKIEGKKVVAERFKLSELSYNLTRHYLVPKHRMCSPEEVAVLKRAFPKLALQSREDAITRFYGLLPGDVVVYHRRRTVGLGGDYYREVS